MLLQPEGKAQPLTRRHQQKEKSQLFNEAGFLVALEKIPREEEEGILKIP